LPVGLARSCGGDRRAGEEQLAAFAAMMNRIGAERGGADQPPAFRAIRARRRPRRRIADTVTTKIVKTIRALKLSRFGSCAQHAAATARQRRRLWG
jgi:hypothetical protein